MRTVSWLPPAVAALLLWGAWGLFQKLATNQMPTKAVYLIGVIAAVLAGAVMLATGGIPPGFTMRGTLYAFLAGISSALAVLLFLASVRRGNASVVITFTALYPLVTIVLSVVILKETISIQQGIGIILALIAMVLLAA
jgi:transporter family protein